MKKIIGLFKRLFRQGKSRSSVFDEAIAEGFKETLKEMGY